MSGKMRSIALSVAAVLLLPAIAAACDPCSLYYATKLHGFEENPALFSISEVYTRFETTSESRSLRNGQLAKDYSTTQFSLSYDLRPGLNARLNYPLIARSFDVVTDFRRKSDNEVGFGDPSLHLSYAPVLIADLDTTYYLDFSLGVKFPTGDTGSLSDSAEDGEPATAKSPLHPLHHTGGGVGVQGRGLSIGTGSFDYIFGTKFFYRYTRFFFYGSLEYFLRTEGDYDYEFGDELVWNFGPSYYLLHGDHEQTAALRLVLSGEHKNDDKKDGVRQSETDQYQLYVGPELLFTFAGRYTAELGLDIPLDGSDGPIEAEARLRASIGYRF